MKGKGTRLLFCSSSLGESIPICDWVEEDLVGRCPLKVFVDMVETRGTCQNDLCLQLYTNCCPVSYYVAVTSISSLIKMTRMNAFRKYLSIDLVKLFLLYLVCIGCKNRPLYTLCLWIQWLTLPLQRCWHCYRCCWVCTPKLHRNEQTLGADATSGWLRYLWIVTFSHVWTCMGPQLMLLKACLIML